MKHIIAMMLTASMVCSNIAVVNAEVPALAYNSDDMEAMRSLINECESLGYNADYEMLNYTVLNRFITYMAEDIERGVSEERLTHNTNYLNGLYTETIDSLNGYLDGSIVPKSKGYDYTNDDYKLSETDFVTADGAPFFSSGFGHGSEASSDLNLFPDMGMNNIQIEIDSSFAIANNDGIPYWKFSAGTTGGTVSVDDTTGHDSSKSLKIVNPHELESNVYLTLNQDVPVKPNTEYTLTFWAKGDSVDSKAVVVYNGWNNDKKYSVTSDWQKYTYTFTSGNAQMTTIRVNVVDKAASLWLDDFSLSGSVIENSGFEEEASDKEYEIYPYNSAINGIRSALAKAEANDVGVCLLLSPHYLKSYINSTYPDVVSSKFGLMNFNVNDPRIKSLLEDYVREILKGVSGFKSLKGICITNEPTFNTSANVDFYEPLYQDYLEEKYGDIVTLRTKWGSYKWSFDRIDMPEAWATTPAYYDWMDFNENVFNEWHAWYAGLVRDNLKGTECEGIPVFSKMMGGYTVGNSKAFMDAGFDPFKMAEWEDLVGFDSGATIDSGRFEKLMATDLLSATADKPLYNSENHVISDGDQNYTSAHASHVYNDLWQHAIHGLDGSTIWVWSRTTSANDDKNGCILNRPDALVSAGRATLDINRNREIINAFGNKEKKVALYYSKSSNLYNRDNYKAALVEAYKELLMAGIRCGFVSEDRISDLDKYDAVVIPSVTNTTEEALTKLSSWASNGGKVVFVGDGCLAKNEYNKTASLTVSGTTVTPDALAEQFSDMITYTAVDSNGVKVEDISVETVEYNEKTYYNICNYSDTDTKTVSLAENGKVFGHYYDCVSESFIDGAITLAPLETKLITEEVIVNPHIPTEINLIISNAHGGTNNPTPGDALEISWKNPSYAISEIDVVNERGRSIVPEGTTLNTESDALNYFRVTGLTAETIYKYTVRITKDNGDIEGYTATGKPRSFYKERQTEDGYKTVWEYKNEGLPAQTATYIDAVEKANGNSSLKIVKNTTADFHFKGENDNADTLEVGAEYEFSFWTKANLKGGRAIVYWLNDWKGTYYAFASNEWVKNTYKLYDIKQDENGKYSFKILDIAGAVQSDQKDLANLNFMPRIVVSGAGVAYIDDIELRKLDENGNPGSNMYVNFSYEYGAASNVNVIKGDAQATISWTNPVSDKITEAVVVDETDTPVATASTTSISNGASNSVVVEGLENNKMYKYFIRLVINGATEYIPVTFVPESSKDPQINEDGYIMSGWNINSSNGNLWSTGSKNAFYISNDAKNGFGSLKIHGKQNYANWGYLKRTVYNLGASKKYKVSLYAKKISSSVSGDVHLYSNNDVKYITNIASTASSGGWTYFESGIITAGANGTMDFRIGPGDFNGQVLIDEMVLTPVDESGEPTGEEVVVIDNFDYNNFKNLMYVPNSDKATITWVNPNNQNITEVYVTNAVGGRVASGLSTAPNGKVSAKVEGLTVGKTETFYVYATIANGQRIKRAVTFVAGDNLPFASTMYTYPEQGFKNEVLQTMDTEVKYSGNSSLKLQSNYVNTYSCLIIPCYNLDTTKKYEATFMYKSKGMEGSAFWTSDDWGERTHLSFNSDWKKATVKWSGKTNLLIRLGLECAFEALWIDDVVVREIDENGNYLSDNLLTDGGFEATKDKVPSIIFDERDGKIKAEIKKYNSYSTDCYVASYDADGKLIEVVKAPADTNGELIQIVTPEVNAGESVVTVKAFVWDKMVSVASKIK